MKITDVEAIVLRRHEPARDISDGTQDACIVRITTDDGLLGIGEVDSSPEVVKAAVEAAQGAWRETNPWHRLYSDAKARTGKANPAKAAVARKVLIACWHVLSREQPFKPHRPQTDPVPASSLCFLAA